MDERDENIEAMVDAVRASAAECVNWTGAPDLDPRVLDALRAVPRDRFAPKAGGNAWANRPQPIGFGQTISQPFIVALMTHFLDVRPGVRVLEIGCGSGYQAAVLAEMGAEVLSLERIPALAEQARATLTETGHAGRVNVRVADGFEPVPEAPFERIIVTASPDRIPRALIGQCLPGGRLVGPRGRQHEAQMLTLVLKDKDGTLDERAILPVAFVPMLKGLSDTR